MSGAEKKIIEKCIERLSEDGVNTKKIVKDALVNLIENHKKKWG